MRRDLLSDESFPPKRFAFHLSEQIPYEHAAALAEAMKSAETIRERLGESSSDVPQMHADFYRSMKAAADTAEEAFEAALKAAWQWYWLQDHCECKPCRIRRAQAAAPMN